MPPMNEKTSSRRQTSQEVVSRRAGESAVRSMMPAINQWRQNAVHIGALLERARTKGEPMEQSLQALDALRNEVVEGIAAWREGIPARDPSGRVADVERAAESILDMVDSLRSRIAS